MFRCEMLFNRTIISFSRKHVNIFTLLILIFGVSPPNNPSSPAGFHRFDENGGLSHCKRERPPRIETRRNPAPPPNRSGKEGAGEVAERTRGPPFALSAPGCRRFCHERPAPSRSASSTASATQQTSSSVRYGWTGRLSTCSQSASLKGSAPLRSPRQANAP